MTSAVSDLVTKLHEKKQQDAQSSFDTFVRLVFDGVDGKLSADQLQQGLALTDRSVEQFQEFAAVVVRRRELVDRVAKGDRASAELAKVAAERDAADAELQAAIERHKAATNPLRLRSEELQAVVANGEHGAKLLIEEAGRLNPAALQTHLTKRAEVYEETAAEVESLNQKCGVLSHELHSLRLSPSFESSNLTPAKEAEFKAVCAETQKAERPRKDADEALRRVKMRPELI
jgi:hypothetical protein